MTVENNKRWFELRLTYTAKKKLYLLFFGLLFLFLVIGAILGILKYLQINQWQEQTAVVEERLKGFEEAEETEIPTEEKWMQAMEQLPFTPERARFLWQLRRVLSESGVSFHSLSSKREQGTDRKKAVSVQKISYSLEISGSYQQVKQLLTAMQELSRVVRVTHFSLYHAGKKDFYETKGFKPDAPVTASVQFSVFHTARPEGITEQLPPLPVK